MAIQGFGNNNSFWGIKKPGAGINTLNLKANNGLAVKPLVGQGKTEVKETAVYTDIAIEGKTRFGNRFIMSGFWRPQIGDKIVYGGKIYRITTVSREDANGRLIVGVEGCGGISSGDLDPNRGNVR